MRTELLLRIALSLPLAVIAGCEAPEGTAGPQGPAGPQGAPGPVGMTMVFDSTCDKVNIGTIADGGGTMTRTAWYADLMIPGLDFRKAPRVSALLCDRQCWGNSCDPVPAPACAGSGGGDCKSSGYDVIPQACVPAPAAASPLHTQIAIDSGHIIVGCGLRVVQTGPTPLEGGIRYQKVFVSVQQ